MRQTPINKNRVLEQATKHWKYLAPILTYPINESDYDLLVERLNFLLDMVGENEKHPLMGLVDVVSNLITSYESKHFQSVENTGIDALKYLMQQHNLNQADLSEIGSQGVVSEILSGKRKLNVRQINSLARRFHVDPITFMDDIIEEPITNRAVRKYR